MAASFSDFPLTALNFRRLYQLNPLSMSTLRIFQRAPIFFHLYWTLDSGCPWSPAKFVRDECHNDNVRRSSGPKPEVPPRPARTPVARPPSRKIVQFRVLFPHPPLPLTQKTANNYQSTI